MNIGLKSPSCRSDPVPCQILIVDDNPDDREMIRRALVRNTLVFSDLPEAVDETSCFEQLNAVDDIRCVLLDYSLPGRDGLRVLEQILQFNPCLAVVMQTRQGNEDIAANAMKVGAQDYLSKDTITDEGLWRTVEKAIERADMQRKIEEQQDSLHTFAHVLVHDLRAPLRSIKQAIGMLMEDTPSDVAQAHAEIFGFVERGASRMDRLILALKAYTEFDVLEPKLEAIDLNVLVENVCSDVAADFEALGASVSFDGSLPNVYANTPQMFQLMQNIILNGVKYNRSSTPLVRIGVHDCGHQWGIEVADNGIGIEQKFLKSIFEPFHRLHNAGEYEGTGLGFVTCAKIAQRHGGALTCHSEVGQGSVCTFKLPKTSCRSRAINVRYNRGARWTQSVDAS